MELHKYLKGQVWQIYDDSQVCLVAISPEENCMIGFNFADGTCNYTHLLSLVPEDMKTYIGTITNTVVIQEILYNYEKRYTNLLKFRKPYVKTDAEPTCIKKVYGPRGHKPHHISIYCPELDRVFNSIRECERFLGVNHGTVRYALVTGNKLNGRYTFEKA